MPQAEYDIYEKRALDAAGRKAGELLDHVYKKTDMAELTPDEWAEFLKTIIDEFGRDLARRLGDATDPPF